MGPAMAPIQKDGTDCHRDGAGTVSRGAAALVAHRAKGIHASDGEFRARSTCVDFIRHSAGRSFRDLAVRSLQRDQFANECSPEFIQRYVGMGRSRSVQNSQRSNSQLRIFASLRCAWRDRLPSRCIAPRAQRRRAIFESAPTAYDPWGIGPWTATRNRNLLACAACGLVPAEGVDLPASPT